MHPKTSRHVSFLAVLFWLTLLAGCWYGVQNTLDSVDQWLFNRLGHVVCHWAPADFPQLLRPGQAVQMEPVVTQTRLRECPTVGMVELNEEACEAAFAAQIGRAHV